MGKIFGVTGITGSGTSTVSAILSEIYSGIIISADNLAHDVMLKGQTAYTEVLHEFGDGILAEDGEINRRALGSIVFADAKKRKVLESIIHPAVISKTKAIIGLAAELPPACHCEEDLRSCSHYKNVQICEPNFSQVRELFDAACPKARKEKIRRRCGNISRKDMHSLVGTRPSLTKQSAEALRATKSNDFAFTKVSARSFRQDKSLLAMMVELVFIIDAPLLIESGMYKMCDTVWLVTATDETRLSRIMDRDNINHAAATARLQSRAKDDILRPYANVIIENNTDLTSLRAQIERNLSLEENT